MSNAGRPARDRPAVLQRAYAGSWSKKSSGPLIAKERPMISSNPTANLCEPVKSPADVFALRRCVCETALRYLRWRSASHLRRLDPRTLKDFGVHAEILSLVERI
jgi:uncharacterized protein YjiS (DUF1127 family)